MPTVEHITLRNYNLNGGIKSEYLDIEATKVEITIEIDQALDDLIKNGKESLKIAHLGDVAKAELDKVAGLFGDTIAGIERKIKSDVLNEDEVNKQIKEANEVLKYYAKIVQANAEAAVQKEWQAYLSRRKHLKNFRVKCATKMVLGSIGMGVAISSAVLSFGTLWMNVAVSVKVFTDLIQTAKTWAQDIDDVYKGLIKDLEKVAELNSQREKAKKTKEWQTKSKTKEGLKELMNGILPITKSMLKCTSEIENSTKQLLGLVSKLEDKADDIVKQMNKTISLMSKLPDKQMTDELKGITKQLEKKFDELFDEIKDLHRRSQNAGKFGENALKAVKKLRQEDAWWIFDPEDTLDMGKNALTAYAVSNFIYQLLMNGKSLIPM